ncbi:MAG: succinylglutamate desuccinylase/aspartoacylase family protein [Acidobacteria bacterium]|nr:succinylglutamate desuccinylase/aspartoacylase family protein [Acidobacteriota bacterium]MCI0719639.1 succinylglutamate desuccinylase/aspartoacylase family protein [Acidobacteriota bacterium]
MPVQWQPDKLKLKSRSRLRLRLDGYSDALRIEIPFYALVGSSRGPKLVVIAGIHGDEFEGVRVLHELARAIEPKKLKGTLTLVPVANPQAFYAGVRRNPVDQGDLNRAFPGSAQGSMTERLAHTILHEFVLGNDYVLSLHGWSKESLVVPYVEYPIGKTEVHRKSCAAAMALGFEYVHPYHWPAGPLGVSALDHGICCY